MIWSILFGIVIAVCFVMKYRHLFITSAFPTDTIRRILHNIMIQSETISNISTPETALIQSRECQSSLNTLIALTGGTQTINAITGVDTETLQNILCYQEKQITSHMNINK
jgi:phosphomevalonate kinase